jgi:hypothetical protein
VTAIAFGSHGGFFNRTSNSGRETAAWVDRILNSAREHYELPITLDPRERAFRMLKDIFDTHRQSDWDGYGALPISQDAYLEARRLLQALPDDILVPEISPDPRGGISFEWYKGPNWVFTLTVKGTGVLVYAGLMGKDNRAYGTQKFSESIPKIILQYIR